MNIMKNFLSLALVSAQNQKISTTDMVFERYERVFDEKNNIFLIIIELMYVLTLAFI